MGYSSPSSLKYSGSRNYNNVLNPAYSQPDGMIEECCEEREPERFKLFPTKEQFDYIKLYYNNPRVDMHFSEIFELTDEQFEELFKIHLKRGDPLNEFNTRDRREKSICPEIVLAYHFFDNYYRFTDKQTELLVDVLKKANVEPDPSNKDDMYSINHYGVTDTQKIYRNTFNILLRGINGTEDEKQKKIEQLYNEIFIPKFTELENKKLIGKRWFKLIEESSAGGAFTPEFIRQHANKFSVDYLLGAKLNYKELMDNDDFKEVIIKILEDDIKDELHVFSVDGVINVDVDFDLDHLTLFKYLEDDRHGYDKCEAGY